MITNAADKLLTSYPGNMPVMTDAMDGWFQQLTFTRITKSIDNFENSEVRTDVTFRGVMQPLTDKQLMMLPEGQRSWSHQWLHAEPDLVLDTDEIVEFLQIPYRVVAKKDYSQNGYVSYQLTEDYRP